MRQTWMFVISFLLSIKFVCSQVFDILRPSVNGRDSFIMPPSMCGDEPLIRCRSFYATTLNSSCSCLCPATNATFTFANNRWMCMANTRARNYFQQGCERKTTFSSENADKRVPTVNISDRREISLRYWPWDYYRCSLNISSSWIMGCNGTKRFLTLQSYNTAARLFTISRRTLASRYILQVNNGVPDSNILKGKIINLNIECTGSFLGHSLTFGNCLVFKLNGKEKCPVNKPKNATFSTIHSMKATYVTPSTASHLETNAVTSAPISLVSPLQTLVTPVVSSYTSPVGPTTTPTSSRYDVSMRISTKSPTSSVTPRTAFEPTQTPSFSSPTNSINNFSLNSVTSSKYLTVSSSMVSHVPTSSSSSSSSSSSAPQLPLQSPSMSSSSSPASLTPPSSPSLSPTPSPSPPSRTEANGKDNRVVITATVSGVVVFGTIVIVVIVFWTRRKARKNNEEGHTLARITALGRPDTVFQLEMQSGSQIMLAGLQATQPMGSQTMPSTAQENQPRRSQTTLSSARHNHPREGRIFSHSTQENQPKYQNVTTDRVRNTTPGKPQTDIQLEILRESQIMLAGAQDNQPRGSQALSSGAQDNKPKERRSRENQPNYQNLIIDSRQSNEAAMHSSPDDYYSFIPGIPVYQMPRKGQSNAATYSSVDEYEESTFYQSLHIPGIPVYQTLKKDQAEKLHYRNVPSPSPNITVLPISKAKITDRDEPRPNGQPSATAPYPVHEQSPEMCSPYTALQKTDDRKESVYEALSGPTQELYGSLWKRGSSSYC